MPTLQATVMTALLPIGVPVRRPRRVFGGGVNGWTRRTDGGQPSHPRLRQARDALRTELARRLGDDEPASAVKTRGDT